MCHHPTCTYDQVLQPLQLESGTTCKYDHGTKFKHCCKSQFKVETICARNRPYCSKTSLPVKTSGEIIYIILRYHLRVGHTGRDKKFDKVNKNYAWVNRSVIHLFLQTRPICKVNKKNSGTYNSDPH